MESIEEVSIELGQGHQLVESSLAVIDQFAGQHDKQTKIHRELNGQLADRASLIELTQARYVDAALQIRDEGFVEEHSELLDDPVPTVNSLLENSQTSLSNLDPSLGDSEQLFSNGAVLAAANQLGLIENEQQYVGQMLSQIRLHCEQVDQISSSNKELLDKRLARLDSLADDLSDNRTQQSTIVSGSALQSGIKQFFEEFTEVDRKRDPFADSAKSSSLNKVWIHWSASCRPIAAPLTPPATPSPAASLNWLSRSDWWLALSTTRLQTVSN